MKYHIEIGTLTKADGFSLIRDQVMGHETWFKLHRNFCNFETAPQLPRSRNGLSCLEEAMNTSGIHVATLSSIPMYHVFCMASFFF